MANKQKITAKREYNEKIKQILDERAMNPLFIILKNTLLYEKGLSRTAMLVIRVIPYIVFVLSPYEKENIAALISEASCFSLILPGTGQLVCRSAFSRMKLKKDSPYDMLALLGTVFTSFAAVFIVLRYGFKYLLKSFPGVFSTFRGIPLVLLVLSVIMIIIGFYKVFLKKR